MNNAAPVERHNVSDPPVQRYHQPGVGGTFAPRFVDMSTTADGTWTAWHGYDAAAGADRIWCQHHPGDEVDCLTEKAGDHMRPAISALSRDQADVLWITDQTRLCHAARCDGAWQNPVEAASSNHWLRDVALHRGPQTLWCVLIESRDDGDALRVLALNDDQWCHVADVPLKGFIARPALAVDGDGRLHITVETYRDSRYVIQHLTVFGDKVTLAHDIEVIDANCTLPRLTTASNGTLWLSFIREQIMHRDGVVSRAAWVDIARLNEDGWSIEQGVAPLHLGLLPRTRYFGYSGLRRNPRLVATDDGAMHLVWEQQRDEVESWENVWNGRLLARTWFGDAWGPTVLWHDGRCCFAVDHRVIHPAGALAVLAKGDHQSDGDDFRMLPIDLQPAPPEAIEEGSGWTTYTPADHPARPSIDLNGETLQLFFGDFHNHSVFSPDAEGQPDELYHFARDVARIDFSGITDNDYYPEKALMVSESAYQRRLTRRLERDDFLPFTGYEWTFHRNDGKDSYNHRSIIFLGDEHRIARRIDNAGSDEANFRQQLAHMNVFAHAHHGEYELLGTEQEANVEITSGWAINMEITETAHEHLNRGRRFGFIGGTDSHRAIPGLNGALVAVWATDLSRESIVSALRARRCYATTGNRAAIDFRINHAFMGEVVKWDGSQAVTCHIRVDSQVALKHIRVIRNGKVVHTIETSGTTVDQTWVDPDPPTDGAWYYLRVEDQTPYTEHPHNVCQAVGHLSWSSPIWLEAGR